jgi:hypothetical protein
VRLLQIISDLCRSVGNRRSAEKRAYELLSSQLSAIQRARFNASGRFEVIGNDTGRRYVIRNLTTLNVDELDSHGQCTRKWCFAPAGNLPQGDILLAQKIALECFESEALARAKGYRPEER